jgi:hypothetical protein
MDYQRYRVSASAREPLLRFILDALRGCGCRIIRATPPTEAPFRISAEAPDGERFGIIPDPDDPRFLAPFHVADRRGQPGRWRTLQPDLV